MQSHDPLKEIEKKAQRYWFEDGIWEIAFGTINLILSAFFLITNQRSWEGPMALVLLALQVGVIAAIYLIINRVVRLMKERLIYPRTGYVAYRRPDRSTRIRRMVRAGLISAAAAAGVGITAALQNARHALPIIIGVVMAFGLAVIGYRFSLLRLYGLAFASVTLGAIIAMLPLNEEQVIAYFFGGFGLLMVFSGAITLLVYLSRTRLPDETSDYLAPDEKEQ